MRHEFSCITDTCSFVITDAQFASMFNHRYDPLDIIARMTEPEAQGRLAVVRVPRDGKYLWLISDDQDLAVVRNRVPDSKGKGYLITSGVAAVSSGEAVFEPDDFTYKVLDHPNGQFLIDGYLIDSGPECPIIGSDINYEGLLIAIVQPTDRRYPRRRMSPPATADGESAFASWGAWLAIPFGIAALILKAIFWMAITAISIGVPSVGFSDAADWAEEGTVWWVLFGGGLGLVIGICSRFVELRRARTRQR